MNNKLSTKPNIKDNFSFGFEKPEIDPDHDLKFEMCYGQEQNRWLYFQHIQLSKIGHQKINVCEKALNQTLKQLNRSSDICRKEIENYEKARLGFVAKKQVEVRKHIISILKSIQTERNSFSNLTKEEKLLLIENRNFIIRKILPELRDDRKFYRSIYLRPGNNVVDEKGRVQFWSKRDLILKWEQNIQNILDSNSFQQ